MDEGIVVGYVADDASVGVDVDRRRARITTEHVPRAEACLAGLDTGRYDCLVSAYDLPGMDGLDFAAAVREEYPLLPFVLCPERGSERTARRAISAGVSEYVPLAETSDPAAALADAVEDAVVEHGRRRVDGPQEELALFFEESPMGAVQWDDEFRFERVNETAEEILGYSEAELRGRSWETIVVEADRQRVGEAVDGLQQKNGGTQVRNRNVRKDGTEITCEWHNRAVTDRNGEVRSIFSKFEDVTEQERRRRELETISTFFEYDQDPGFLIDTPGEAFTIERINPAYVRQGSVDRSQFEGQTLREALGEDRAEKLERRYRECIERREPIEYETELMFQDQPTVWWTRLAPVVIDDTVEYLAGSTREVTEQRRRKAELERYETVIEALNDGVYVLDETGRFTYVNDAFTELVGYDEQTLLGSTPALIKDREGIERGEQHLRRLLSADGPDEVTFEIDIQSREGETIVCEDHMGVLPYDGSEFEGSVGTVRDVTARRKQARELRWLRRVVESAAHAIYLTKPDGTITYVNNAFEEITGYSRAGAIGEIPSQLHADARDEEHVERRRAALRDGEVWEEEVTNSRKGNGEYTARQYIVPVTGPAAEVERFAAFQVDISERKERERHLNRLDRLLRHNLRNDLNVIRGRAEGISLRADDENTAAAEQILRKTDELLDKAEKERAIATMLSARPELGRVDIASAVRDAVARIETEEPTATIRVSSPSDLTALATKRIGQAVEELLRNAITHGDPERHEVSIRVEAGTDRVRIEIEDGNHPIPEMESRLLVEGEELNPLYHGTGLGLWLVYLIVTRSNGTVTVDESESGGNRIRIELDRGENGRS